MYLSDANPRENALLYAVKKAASFQIANENWDHFVRWLLYAARRSSTCLAFIIEHLSVHFSKGKPLPISEIETFIHQQIPLRAEAAHTSEVVWLIFWARELGLSINANALARALTLRSSACALVTLDMLQRGKISGPLDVAFWKSFASTDGLKSEMWLSAYEITKKNWWPRPKSTNYISNHPFFSDLYATNIEFYDRQRRARPRSGSAFFNLIARAKHPDLPSWIIDSGYF